VRPVAAVPVRLERPRRAALSGKMALALVVAGFVALATVLVFARPPWETSDESDHVRNVESIARGSLYPIARGHGLEAVQPPLYYAALAGWQALAGERATTPDPVSAPGCALFVLAGRAPRCWRFRHDLPRSSSDRRLVELLRLPGVLLGGATILLTAATAARLSRDRWTPVLAAAIVAFEPTFVFVSTGVNNDVLAIALASVATFVAVWLVTGSRGRSTRRTLIGSAALGVIIAALAQTKLTGLLLLPGTAAAVWWAVEQPAMRARLLGVFAVCGVLGSGWWLVRNTTLYGDPLALAATSRVNHQLDPLEYRVHPLRQLFVEVPRTIWKQFWFIDQPFEWPWWVYLPFWALAGVGLGGVVLRLRRRLSRSSRPLLVLVLLALGGLLTVWIIGVQDSAAQARLAFIGLPAIACLIVLGAEHWRLPLVARAALPVICLAGTLVALFTDVITIPGG
jgi:hypothetical protein